MTLLYEEREKTPINIQLFSFSALESNWSLKYKIAFKKYPFKTFTHQYLFSRVTENVILQEIVYKKQTVY